MTTAMIYILLVNYRTFADMIEIAEGAHCEAGGDPASVGRESALGQH